MKNDGGHRAHIAMRGLGREGTEELQHDHGPRQCFTKIASRCQPSSTQYATPSRRALSYCMTAITGQPSRLASIATRRLPSCNDSEVLLVAAPRDTRVILPP